MLTLEILKTLDYKISKKVISKLNKQEKKELLETITINYNDTISSLKGYVNVPFGSSLISERDYFLIMSVCKKLEILMSFCYE